MSNELGVPSNIKNQILTADGELVPGFSGMSIFRGRNDYTDDERTVLKHFFTNIDSNVYAATDHMPNELWALVMGQYARSNLTARDRFLGLFEEMHKKQNASSVSEIATQIRSQGDIYNLLDSHLKAAGKFIEEWGVAYGHASLRDSGTIRMCFEGVSQRATKELESAREGAYQEQSTRALPFEARFLGMPFELRGTKFEEPLQNLNLKLINFYERLNENVKVHVADKFAGLRTEANQQIADELGTYEFSITDKQWSSIVGAKAFDVARYMLPQNMTTSLGVTLNTRRFLDQLTEWQSSPLIEMRVLGLAAQIEAKKISPTLMKYGDASEFFSELPERRANMIDKFVEGEPSFEYKDRPVTSTLIESTPNLEDWVLASILFNGSDGARSLPELKAQVKKLSPDARHEIAASQFSNKASHEINAKAMEIGSVMFERIYDIGAYRDLQRQRGDRQQKHRYSVIGFHMPVEVAEVGMGQEFTSLMHEVKEFQDKLIQAGQRSAAEYVPVMANTIRQITTKDPVQQMYEAKLRTVPAGIDSYRDIVQQETEQMLKLMPSFRRLIEVDNNYYSLGRLHETVKGTIRKEKEKRAT